MAWQPLPPRAAKQMAAYSLSAGEERIYGDSYQIPKKTRKKRSKPAKDTKNASPVLRSDAVPSHENENVAKKQKTEQGGTLSPISSPVNNSTITITTSITTTTNTLSTQFNNAVMAALLAAQPSSVPSSESVASNSSSSSYPPSSSTLPTSSSTQISPPPRKRVPKESLPSLPPPPLPPSNNTLPTPLGSSLSTSSTPVIAPKKRGRKKRVEETNDIEDKDIKNEKASELEKDKTAETNKKAEKVTEKKSNHSNDLKIEKAKEKPKTQLKTKKVESDSSSESDVDKSIKKNKSKKDENNKKEKKGKMSKQDSDIEGDGQAKKNKKEDLSKAKDKKKPKKDMCDRELICGSDDLPEELQTHAYKYSIKPNADMAKLAKKIQSERNKEFVYLKQNVFFGRKARVMDLDDISVCQCYNIEGVLSCEENCMNRFVFYECDPRMCACGSLCRNQRFQRAEYAKVWPFRTALKGWGLKAMGDIQKGQFVIEYCGEVISNEVCRKRLENAPAEDNFYYITLDKAECLDASLKGNLARFMNHSCKPNCHTQKWYVNGEVRIGLFAIDDIKKGTELTFDYNFERFGSRKQTCHCGSSNCRGFLGAKPKHMDTKSAKKKISTSNTSSTANGNPRKRKSVHTPTKEITLVDQKWGLPAPKKTKPCITVDHMGHVSSFLAPQGGAKEDKSQTYLPRNLRLVRKYYVEQYKTFVTYSLAKMDKKRSTKPASIKSPTSISPSPSVASPTTSTPTSPIPTFTSNPASPSISTPTTPLPSTPTSAESNTDDSIAKNASDNSSDKLDNITANTVKSLSSRRRKKKAPVKRITSILDAVGKITKVPVVKDEFMQLLDKGLGPAVNFSPTLVQKENQKSTK